MIRHIVALRLDAAQDRSALRVGLAALLPLVPGALSFRWFDNVSPEATVVHGFCEGFEFTFADRAARDAYLVHPAHQAMGAHILSAAGGPDGVIVLDIAG